MAPTYFYQGFWTSDYLHLLLIYSLYRLKNSFLTFKYIINHNGLLNFILPTMKNYLLFFSVTSLGSYLEHILGTPGFCNKLSVLCKGPGWGPGKPRLGLPEEIPVVNRTCTGFQFCVIYLDLLMLLYQY